MGLGLTLKFGPDKVDHVLWLLAATMFLLLFQGGAVFIENYPMEQMGKRRKKKKEKRNK